MDLQSVICKYGRGFCYYYAAVWQGGRNRKASLYEVFCVLHAFGATGTQKSAQSPYFGRQQDFLIGTILYKRLSIFYL